MAKKNPFKVAAPGGVAAVPMPMPDKSRKATGPPKKVHGRQMGPTRQVDDSVKKMK